MYNMILLLMIIAVINNLYTAQKEKNVFSLPPSLFRARILLSLKGIWRTTVFT